MEIGQLFVTIGAKTEEFAKGLVKAESLTSTFAGNVNKICGVAGVALLGLATAVAAFTVKSWAEIDRGLDAVIAATGAIGDEAKQLEKVFKGVYASVQADSETTGKVVGHLAAVFDGLTNRQLKNLARALLELSRLTGEDAVQATQQFSKAVKDFEIPAEQTSLAMDKMWTICQKTGVSFTKLAELTYQYGSPLRLLGFTFEQTIATMGAFERAGVRTELVMGAMRIATGEFARQGIPLREGLMATIEKIKNMEDSSKATALAMEIFGARAGPDMAAAIREGRFEVSELINSLSDAGGAVSRTITQTKDWNDHLIEIKHQLQLGAAAVGETLIPALSSLVSWLQKAVTATKSLAETHPSLIRGFILIGAAIGGLLISIPLLSAIFIRLKTALLAFTGALETGYIWWLLHGVVIKSVIGAISLVAIGIITLIGIYRSLKELVEKANEGYFEQASLLERLKWAGERALFPLQGLKQIYEWIVPPAKKTREELSLQERVEREVASASREAARSLDELRRSEEQQPVALEKAIGLFETFPERTRVSGQQLIQNLREQIKAFTEWRQNLVAIAQRGGIEMAMELQKMGPQFAGEVDTIRKMTDAEFQTFKALFQQRTRETVDIFGMEFAKVPGRVAAAGPTIRQAGANLIYDLFLGMLQNMGLPPQTAGTIAMQVAFKLRDLDTSLAGQQVVWNYAHGLALKQGLPPAEAKRIADSVIANFLQMEGAKAAGGQTGMSYGAGIGSQRGPVGATAYSVGETAKVSLRKDASPEGAMTGGSYASGLSRQRPEVAAASGGLVATVRAFLTADVSDRGEAVGKSWVRGIIAGILRSLGPLGWAVEMAMGYLRRHSPPGMRNWPEKRGVEVGRAWIGGIVKGMRALTPELSAAIPVMASPSFLMGMGSPTSTIELSFKDSKLAEFVDVRIDGKLLSETEKARLLMRSGY